MMSSMKFETCSNNNINDSRNDSRTISPMTTWSQCELQNLRDCFELLDTQNKGEILVDELCDTLEELRTVKNDSTMGRNIKSLLASLQPFSPDAKLSWGDFVSLLTTPNPTHSKDDIEKIFDLFDVDGKGYINMKDLRSVANDLGEYNVSDSEIHEMIQRVSSAGRVTLDQFREIMKNHIGL